MVATEMECAHMNRAGGARRGPGRPKAIPPRLFATVLKLYDGGFGYRSIANQLQCLGVLTTHTTVRRMIRGEGAYERRVHLSGTSVVEGPHPKDHDAELRRRTRL